MLTIETLAEIDDDGILTAHAPAFVPRGRRRVVIVIDDARPEDPSATPTLPDLGKFRASLGGRPYPGNSVVDMRDEER